jgi:glycosyltransferase involved in cell wall biosynthesis
MPKISCIIPAYNEASRISDVIDMVICHPLIEEVIVINDGSTDTTQTVLEQKASIQLINHPQNMGKTQAVLTGLKKAKNPYVMLIDADLIGLTGNALTDLIRPVLDGRADISISLRNNSLSLYKILGLDFVSGERVFKKELLLSKQTDLEALPGFGLEVFINEQIILHNLQIHISHWESVISPRKSAKLNFLLGSLQDIKMINQILHTISPQRCAFQIFHMRKFANITFGQTIKKSFQKKYQTIG